MQRIRRRCLEFREMPVEGSRLIALGVDEQRPHTDLLARARHSVEHIFYQRRAEPAGQTRRAPPPSPATHEQPRPQGRGSSCASHSQGHGWQYVMNQCRSGGAESPGTAPAQRDPARRPSLAAVGAGDRRRGRTRLRGGTGGRPDAGRCRRDRWPSARCVPAGAASADVIGCPRIRRCGLPTASGRRRRAISPAPGACQWVGSRRGRSLRGSCADQGPGRGSRYRGTAGHRPWIAEAWFRTGPPRRRLRIPRGVAVPPGGSALRRLVDGHGHSAMLCRRAVSTRGGSARPGRRA